MHDTVDFACKINQSAENGYLKQKHSDWANLWNDL
jgi:hypothetical protein